MVTFSRTAGRSSRPSIDVLVLDAQFRQALSTLRTLSRAGLQVGAVACQTDVEGAIAQRSCWCKLAAAVPDFAIDPDGYLEGLLALLEDRPAGVIVPCDDGSIETIRTRRSAFEALTAVPLASEAALDLALSKTRTLALARILGIGVPRSVTVTAGEDVRAAMREVGYPAVVKPSKSWVAGHRNASRLVSQIAGNLAEAQQQIEAVHEAGAEAIVQQWLPGAREAVTLFQANGQICARFVQKSYRELPVLGGASVLCESIPPLADLVDPAERLVRTMALDGCSMVEFRRDQEGRPLLMEVNPRLPGSVTLAMACGVDFPRLLYAWAVHDDLHPITSYQIGRRLRWLVGDLWSLRSSLSGAGQPDAETPMRAVSRFLYDFVRRPSMLDVIERDDIRPAMAELHQMIVKPALRRLQRTCAGTPDTYETPMVPRRVDAPLTDHLQGGL